MTSFSDWTFAVEWNDFEILWFGLDVIVATLSRIWVFFAKLAWTFLTNKWIYGEVLWLDALLWKFRNMMKNIANFGLWFYFVYIIAKWIIKQWKEDITKKLKDIILRLLVAWIWIQASWFLTAVVIDVSTITLAAAWAFPSQIIAWSPQVEKSMKQSLEYHLDDGRNRTIQGKEITIFPTDSKASDILKESPFKIDQPEDFSWFVDKLMPNADDVSWPLYFMWFSILKTDVLASLASDSVKWTKATILNIIIQWWTTIVYAIEMFVLCIVALIRILYLWMFIVLSPLAVLIRCIGKSWEKLWNHWFLNKLSEQISFKTFFVNVFKPTIIVLWIWVASIFVSLMNGVALDSIGKPFDSQWMTFSSQKDSTKNTDSKWDETYTSILDNNLLSFTLTHAWKTLLELALSIITVIIVYLIISIAVKMWWWNDFVSKKINGIQEWIGWALWSLPVVPVAWYDKNWNPETHRISAKKTFWLGGSRSLLEEKISYTQRKVDEVNNEHNQIISSWFGDGAWYLSAAEITKIGNAGAGETTWLGRLTAKRDAIEKSEKWKWMTLNPATASNDGFWIKQFTEWLEKSKDQTIYWMGNDKAWNDMIKRWNKDDNKKQGLEQMFKNNESGETNSVKAYADFFGLWNITTWEGLKDLDISKK